MKNIKEILLYHHSHLDVGYTHPQPVLWELQKSYIDQVINLCEQTENETEDRKFRWTCETTEPVVKWLECASNREIERFSKYVKNGQICITALSMHSTPLSNVEQIIRMLYSAETIRRRFNSKVNTAINHDVNGQPWSFSQLLLDAGVELYTTGINIHFGGIPLPRPLLFRWQSPDGRELLTFNGEHYSIFTQFCELWDKDLDKMKKGIDSYLERLDENYPYEFVYLSSTNVPMLDNTPPDEELLEMVNQWNEANLGPKIKLATPEMLLEKVKQIPYSEIPVYSGDWTDYWNFGSASSAFETRLSRRTKQTLKTAEFITAFNGCKDNDDKKIIDEAWKQLELFDEHTWGANVSVSDPDSLFTKTLWMHKAHSAYQANSLSGYELIKQLEMLASNPLQSRKPEGILLMNPTQLPQTVDVRLPDELISEGRHTAANRYKYNQNNDDPNLMDAVMGTVEIPAFSWKKVPIKNMRKKESNKVAVTDCSIESPYYRLEFDKETGRITGLLDKKRNWQIVDQNSEWTLFQYIQERVDPLHQIEDRKALFPREIKKVNENISCWNHNWKAVRRGPNRNLECKVEKHESGATLILKWDAPGVDWLEQRITLFSDIPKLRFDAKLFKKDIREPEAVYFSFPLNLKTWKAKFNSAGTFVEMDEEQLPAACKDWVTVEDTISIFDDDKGLTLACPDAPLVQVGDFNFGKEQTNIPRTENPLLLAWPMNNYWDTNFCANQPGVVSFKYEMTTFSDCDSKNAFAFGVNAHDPVQIYPAVYCVEEETEVLLKTSSSSVVILNVRPSNDKEGILLRLLNLSENQKEQQILKFPGQQIISSDLIDLFENQLEALSVDNDETRVTVPARGIVSIKLKLGNM